MKEMQEKIYCSLDIETSGFDPKVAEILEIGMVFFTPTKKGLKILEKYESVFKPKMPVPAKIFGLTGISEQELENAVEFSQKKQEIQEKLKDAVIVGHNVGFDIKFLEGAGIKFSGEVVDTLDLVQWILPTHPAYNLENLMDLFKIEHQNAHRALADAVASVKLLERILGIYQSFEKSLKQDIEKILKKQNFFWKSLLSWEIPVFEFKKPNPVKEQKPNSLLELKEQTIFELPFGQKFSQLPKYLNKQKYLLVLPKKQEAVNLWKNRLADAVFNSEDLFSQEKFEKFSKQKNLTSDQARFVLKILVWQKTNWQNECLLDLNLSFFGGQFKSEISGGKQKQLTARALVCDHETFLKFGSQDSLQNRFVAICALSDFEEALSKGIGKRVSWGAVAFTLKSFYNPELGVGAEKYKETIAEALKETDLFFGIVQAFWQTDPPGFVNVKITDEVLFSENFKKIKMASNNYCAKLAEYAKILDSEKLLFYAENLQAFFSEESNTVKWIELSPQICSFHSSPIEIKQLMQKLMQANFKICFFDWQTHQKVWQYFVFRLGLENFSKQRVSFKKEKKLLKKIQQELFALQAKTTCKIVLRAETLTEEKILKHIVPKNLPAAVLFSGQQAISEFYESNFLKIKKYAKVIAQGGSGGSSKIFNNFSIHPSSVLLVSDRFVLKFLQGQAVDSEKVCPKILLLLKLPFEQFTHPYQEAVAGLFENAFSDYALPRAILNLGKILGFFYSDSMQKIYLFDPKLQKDYAKVFYEYLGDLEPFSFEK